MYIAKNTPSLGNISKKKKKKPREIQKFATDRYTSWQRGFSFSSFLEAINWGHIFTRDCKLGTASPVLFKLYIPKFHLQPFCPYLASFYPPVWGTKWSRVHPQLTLRRRYQMLPPSGGGFGWCCLVLSWHPRWLPMDIYVSACVNRRKNRIWCTSYWFWCFWSIWLIMDWWSLILAWELNTNIHMAKQHVRYIKQYLR